MVPISSANGYMWQVATILGIVQDISVIAESSVG